MIFSSMEQDLRDIKDRLMGKPKRSKPENISINPSEASNLLAEEINQPLDFPGIHPSDTNKEKPLTITPNKDVSEERESKDIENISSGYGASQIVAEIENIEDINLETEAPSAVPEMVAPMATISETKPGDYDHIPQKSKAKLFGLLLLVLLIVAGGSYFVYSSYMQKERDKEDALIEELARQNLEAEEKAAQEEVLPESEYFIDNTAEIQTQKANDALRLERVSNFANTLIQYSLETNTAIPVSETYSKLNETNAISDLMSKALARDKQEESILLDPKNPEFYFAYKSLDGKEFEFTSRMEAVADHDCAQEDFDRSGICVYRYVMDEEMIASVKNILK
jgi:hypothetical protein